MFFLLLHNFLVSASSSLHIFSSSQEAAFRKCSHSHKSSIDTVLFVVLLSETSMRPKVCTEFKYSLTVNIHPVCLTFDLCELVLFAISCNNRPHCGCVWERVCSTCVRAFVHMKKLMGIYWCFDNFPTFSDQNKGKDSMFVWVFWLEERLMAVAQNGELVTHLIYDGGLIAWLLQSKCQSVFVKILNLNHNVIHVFKAFDLTARMESCDKLGLWNIHRHFKRHS